MFHGCAVLAVADDKDNDANIFNWVVSAAMSNSGSDTLFVHLVFCMRFPAISVPLKTTDSLIVTVDLDEINYMFLGVQLIFLAGLRAPWKLVCAHDCAH